MRHRFWLALAACLAAATTVVPTALAFDCVVAKKPAAAGAAGIVDIRTDAFTPLKPNPGSEEHLHGGFIALTDGDITVSTFVHAPGGVLPPAREGGSQHNCDGKGIDSLEVCFGE